MSTYNSTTPSTIRDTRRQDGVIVAVIMAASQTFRKGDLVCVDHTDGLAYPGATGLTLAALDVCMGVAIESKVSTSGSAAATPEYIRVDTSGVHDFTVASDTVANLMGQVMYMDDTSTVNPSTVNKASTTHRPAVGHVVGCATASSVVSIRVKLNCPNVAG